MSDHYGATSLKRLATTHPLIQKLMKRVGVHFPNTVLEGERSASQQRENVAKGVSKTMNSKHLTSPGIRDKSEAVDAAPDPLKWPQAGKLRKRIEAVAGGLDAAQEKEIMALVGDYVKEVSIFYYFGGYVLGTAQEMDIDIRWGGDWDGDRDIDDQTFDDLVHFEVRT